MDKVKHPFDKPLFETRVKIAKQKLRDNKVRQAKIRFADKYYGKMFKADSIRFDNLYAGYIADEQFTINLEEFANNF